MSQLHHASGVIFLPIFPEHAKKHHSQTAIMNRQPQQAAPKNQLQLATQGTSAMDVTATALSALFTGFKAMFGGGFDSAPSDYKKIAMIVQSTMREEVYPWLGEFPMLREFVGDRVIKQLSTHGFAIKNRKFESTVSVKRDDIADDNFGLYAPLFSEIGRTTGAHPDEIIFKLLADGFSTKCYDEQNFFDADHPAFDKEGNVAAPVSNMQAGSGPAWFLMDTSRAVKPVIWQVREDYKFSALDKDTDHNAFFREEYIYGVRARVNAGFGLWQLAFGSKAELTPANYKAARTAMSGYRSEAGRRLGIRPNVLVVPPELEEAGLQILKASQVDSTSNVWQGSADLIVTNYLD